MMNSSYDTLVEKNRKGVDHFTSKSFRQSLKHFAMALSSSRNIIANTLPSPPPPVRTAPASPFKSSAPSAALQGPTRSVYYDNESYSRVTFKSAAQAAAARSGAYSPSSCSLLPQAPASNTRRQYNDDPSCRPPHQQGNSPSCLELCETPFHIYSLQQQQQQQHQEQGREMHSTTICTLEDQILASATVVFNLALCYHRGGRADGNGEQVTSSSPACPGASSRLAKARALYEKCLELLSTLSTSPAGDGSDTTATIAHDTCFLARYAAVSRAASSNLTILQAEYAFRALASAAA